MSRFETGGRLKSQDTLTEKNAFCILCKFARLFHAVFIWTTPEELNVLFEMQFTYLDMWQTIKKWFLVTTIVLY